MRDAHDAAGFGALLESTEAEAYADLLRAAPSEWGCLVETTAAGSLLLAPRLDMLLFNRLIGLGVGSPAERADVDRAIGRAAGVRNFGVQLSPEARPAVAQQWLADGGLAPRDRWTKLWRADGPIETPDVSVRISEIAVRDAPVFAAVTTSGFGMPPQLQPWIASIVGRPGWIQYLASDGDQAVAAASLFIVGHVGWLGIASTVPGARRRGAQRALIARRLQDGLTRGCRWFVTETAEDLPERPNPSFHNVRRAGFQVAYQRPNFMLPPA